jgi:hypothetical protein
LQLSSQRPAEKGIIVTQHDENWKERARQNESVALDWEDPRLVRSKGGQILAMFQYNGRPVGVAKVQVLDDHRKKNGSLVTLSSVVKLRVDGFKLDQASKNWMPFFVDETLHVLWSTFPLRVLRCDAFTEHDEGPEKKQSGTETQEEWTTCVWVHEEGGRMQQGEVDHIQREMLFRGGSQLEPLDSEGGFFFGFLHTRIKCDKSHSFLHLPVLVVIQRLPVWKVVLVSNEVKLDPAFAIAQPNANNVRPPLLQHFIQDPVSIARVDRLRDEISLTINFADGVCGVVRLKKLLGPMQALVKSGYSSSKDRAAKLASRLKEKIRNEGYCASAG